MMKKNIRGFINILTVASIILIISIGIFVGVKQFEKEKKSTSLKALPKTTTPTQISTQSAQEVKTFKSSNAMNFTIEVPKIYEVEEKFGRVTIKSPSGDIYVNQTGTNFGNINNYLTDLKETNKFKLKEEVSLSINTHEAVSGIIVDEKIYFIYVQNTVYTVSTKMATLYSDLDQIAQSFRYTP